MKRQNITNRPDKKTTKELFRGIREALETGNYYFTHHAKKRTKQRVNVNELQVIRILKGKSKYHEAQKDRFNEKMQTWNYSIRGNSVDSEDIRVVLSFDKSDMLIVTVINMGKLRY